MVVFGIVATNELTEDHPLGLTSAACARGWDVSLSSHLPRRATAALG